MTMHKRVAYVEKKYRVSCSLWRLRHLYKMHKIKRRTTYTQYAAELKDPAALLRDRTAFARKMQGLLDANAPIIYVDESTCNAWLKQKKVFFYGTTPFKVPLCQKRGKGITIIAGVGNCINGPVYTLAESTNADDFAQFLAQLKEAQEEHFPGLTHSLIFDNHW